MQHMRSLLGLFCPTYDNKRTRVAFLASERYRSAHKPNWGLGRQG